MGLRPSGDGWAWCGRGHRHWGRHGAAGLLLHAVDTAGELSVLLQHRALWSHHGGSWGLPGGARRSAAETVGDAAVRETTEEVVIDLTELALTGVYLDDHGGWTYATVFGRLDETRSAVPAAAETLAVRWVPIAEVPDLPLHPGFAATWPMVNVA